MEPNLNQTPAPPRPIGKDHESGREFSRLALLDIRTNGGTQTRAELDQGAVNDYAEAIEDGATFPPVVVFYDGNDYWLADGFHRYRATEKAGRTHIDADVRQGNQRAAILHSVGANADHGLRRNGEDKRRAVQTLLDDPEWSEWSDREIARRCRVSPTSVGQWRKLTVQMDSDRRGRKYTTRHGTEATMRTGNIGAPSSPGRTIQRVTSSEFNQMWDDSDVQVEAAMAAHDREAERDERIGMAGAAAVEDDNENLRRQLADRDRTIARVTRERDALRNQVAYWKREAIALGWKHAAEEGTDAA